MDGHHRWAQLYAVNRNAKIKVKNINKPELKPYDVLKAIQAAIALKTGEVKTARVSGDNMLKMGRDDLVAWFKKNVKPEFYEKVEKKEEDVLNYVWKNVESMQKNSQPIPGASPRGAMPKTDDVDWSAPLQTGQVDIVDPHTKLKEEGVGSKDDDLVMEHWRHLAGLLKG